MLKMIETMFTNHLTRATVHAPGQPEGAIIYDSSGGGDQ